MNDAYLKKAIKQIADERALILLASKRAKELALGGRPLIKTNDVNHLDIALLEIGEGLLSYELPEQENDDNFLSID